TMVPVWESRPVVVDGDKTVWDKHHILICDFDPSSLEEWERRQVRVRLERSISKSTFAHERFLDHAVRVFERIRSIFEESPKGATLLQVAIPASGEGRIHGGLSGMLKTATEENPNLRCQLIAVDPADSMDAIGERLFADARCLEDHYIRQENGERLVQTWRELEFPDTTAVEKCWSSRGVYLITGGAGGLGLLFAQEIAASAPGASLILTGRSPMSDSLRERIE